MYLTNKRICFHSHFNAKTLIGRETKFEIPFKNITGMNKQFNAKIFDNSISITTKENKEIFFTSFMHRDIAIAVI